MIDFADRIKKLRQSRNMTQTELAKQLGITRSIVSAYELGTRSPSHDVLLKISGLFSVTLDYLFGIEFRGVSLFNIQLDGMTERERDIMWDLTRSFDDKRLLLEILSRLINEREVYNLLTDEEKFVLDNLLEKENK